LRFKEDPPPGASNGTDTRLVFLGDDSKGEAIEVMAIKLEDKSLLVIHAMPLRERYRERYEEAMRWRK
jgi:hypothetical protein